MSFPAERDLRVGFIAAFANPESARETATAAEARGYDSLWVGDHVSFPVPIFDPFLQLAQLAAFSSRLETGSPQTPYTAR